MDTFLMIIFCLSLIAFIILFTLLILNVVRKKPITKVIIPLGISFWIAVISLVVAALLDPDSGSKTTIIAKSSTPEITVKTTAAPNPSETETTTLAPETEDQNEYFTKADGSMSEFMTIDTCITDLMIEKGYSIEHATAIQEVLNTVGIEYLEIESMTGKPESGLNSVVSYPNGYTERDRRFYFTTDNAVIFYAGFLNEDLYDSEKGGYLKNYNDVHVPEKEVTRDEFYKLQEIAEPVVKQCMNYPNTASIDGFSYRVGRSDENYQLLGNVTAKNGFGIKDTLPFSVWFVKSGEEFTIKGISVDGVRVK